jgi:dTDP-glucose 4,6-dehydratase
MLRLLVTGGAGFIGTNFVYWWRRHRPASRIVVLDALTYAGNIANLSPLADDRSVSFVQGDICDEAQLARLFEVHQFDVVVHFAAESHVDRSIVAPDAFIRTNVQGTHALLKTALAAWSDRSGTYRFHHVSTDEVYGSLGFGDPPFTELSPYDPRSPYAASKAASDFLVRAYHHTYGLPVTISNCSNNYGPYQFPEKLVPLMIVNALSGLPLPVYGDGMNVRDWLHVEDHCAALAAILESGRVGETYNIGGGNEVCNNDLVSLLCELLDARLRDDPDVAASYPDCPAASGGTCRDLMTYVKDRPGHDRRYAIDASKLANELGAASYRPLTEGLQRTIDWYLTHASWWRPIRSGEYRNWMASHYGMAL